MPRRARPQARHGVHLPTSVWGHTYTFTRQLLAITPGTVGKRVLAKEFAKTVKAIEARNDEPQRDAQPSAQSASPLAHA